MTFPMARNAIRHDLYRIWLAHKALLILVGSHAVAVPLLLYTLGLERFFRGPRYQIDVLWWLVGFGVVITLLANRQLKARFTLERLGSAFLVWALHPVLYANFSSFKQAMVHLTPYRWDAAFHSLDVTLHAGAAWELAAPAMTPGVLRILSSVYLAWFPVQAFFLLGTVWAPPSVWRSRCLLAYALLWIGLGNIAALPMGAGGPCFYTHFVEGMADPYAPLWDRLRPLDLSAQRLQGLVLEGAVADTWSPFTGIAAMPSLHVGVAVYFVFVCWTVRAWWLRAAGVIYALLVFVASVLLGWHYAVDGYVAALGAWILWWLAGRWTKDAVLDER